MGYLGRKLVCFLLESFSWLNEYKLWQSPCSCTYVSYQSSLKEFSEMPNAICRRLKLGEINQDIVLKNYYLILMKPPNIPS